MKRSHRRQTRRANHVIDETQSIIGRRHNSRRISPVACSRRAIIPIYANQRYPDPAVQILDPSFAKYRIYSSTVEQVATGFRWAEGPAYFPEGGYLLFSDIPNNRIMKFDEKTGKTTVFRANANYANGNTRDRQGRLITCEHSVTRRVTRTEKNGKITVLADKFNGKRLNAPNDIVVKSDDSIWFTDPLFGINGEWEGKKEKTEQETTNVYRIAKDGKITAIITDLVNPNGLAFSPDEKKLYVVEWKGTPNRSIWSFDVNDDGTVGGKTKLIDAADFGALDGFRVDRDGNLWVGYGSNGALQDDADRRRRPQSVPAQGQVRRSRRRHGVQSTPASPSASSACPNAAPTSSSAAPSATAST